MIYLLYFFFLFVFIPINFNCIVLEDIRPLKLSLNSTIEMMIITTLSLFTIAIYFTISTKEKTLLSNKKEKEKAFSKSKKS